MAFCGSDGDTQTRVPVRSVHRTQQNSDGGGVRSGASVTGALCSLSLHDLKLEQDDSGGKMSLFFSPPKYSSSLSSLLHPSSIYIMEPSGLGRVGQSSMSTMSPQDMYVQTADLI